MSNKERQEIITIFKSNMKGYLAINNIQEAITSITYLFWNSKYNLKKELPKNYTQSDLDIYLQSGNQDNQDFIWNICNCIRDCMITSNLKNIIEYLDKFTEKQLIEIICEDYSMYSRYNISTPDSIKELTYEILELKNKGSNVIDICSYTGNFLTYYAKKNNNYKYTGIEINYMSNMIAQERMNSLKVAYNLITNNVFDYKFIKKYDKIFCNYPFGIKLDQRDLELINKNRNVLDYQFANRISSCWAFVNSVINSISDNGTAVVVMNNGGLYKMPDAEYRKLLVENGYVECVISLPERLFTNTGIPITILVLSKHNKQVKFINAESMILKQKNNKAINELNITDILKEYKSLENTEYTRIISNADIAKNNYSLYVQNYMNIEEIDVKCPKKLNDICDDIFRGYQLSANEINQFAEKKGNRKEYRIINITNINEGNIDEELTKIYPDNEKIDKYILKNQDLLVSSKGTLSKFAVIEIKNGERYIPSGNFTILRLNTDIINPYYLKMFFESNKGIMIINSIKSGGVLPAINLSQLKEIDVPVPPIEEQEKALNRFLAKNDEIKMLKNKLKKLEENLSDIANEEF